MVLFSIFKNGKTPDYLSSFCALVSFAAESIFIPCSWSIKIGQVKLWQMLDS
jgi:hypothetical protein